MPISREGRLAQLVEHLVYTERVSGSSPLAPTMVFQWRHRHYPRKSQRNLTSGIQVATHGQGVGHLMLPLRMQFTLIAPIRGST